MTDTQVRTPQAVEIELLEELVERSYAYLRHFTMVREKETARLAGQMVEESWKMIRHQKQKQIYRQCGGYCQEEKNRGLADIWQKRADRLYARGDFDGLLQLRQHIEVQSFRSTEYAQLLQARHRELQDEIAIMREATRRLRISMMREKQLLSPRML